MASGIESDRKRPDLSRDSLARGLNTFLNGLRLVPHRAVQSPIEGQHLKRPKRSRGHCCGDPPAVQNQTVSALSVGAESFTPRREPVCVRPRTGRQARRWREILILNGWAIPPVTAMRLGGLSDVAQSNFSTT